MEIPSKVTIFNSIMEIKGKQGTIISIGENGYYEITMEFNQKVHTVLLPVAGTVVVFNEPVPQIAAGFDVER